MDAVFEKIERETIPEIEKALGREARIGAREDGLLQFKIVAEENLADTKGRGRWREFIRRKILEAGAGDAKVSPIASPFRPDLYSLYAVTALAEKTTCLAGR